MYLVKKNMKKDNSMHHIENQREKDLDYSVNLNQLWDESSGENIDKLRAFARHVPYTELSKFVLKYELFKKIVNNITKIKINENNKLKVGNINIKRDWGWAPEYMKTCHRILNSKK